MQINISGHQLELTPAIKNYVEAKIGKLVRHNDRITSVNVTLSVDKLEQKAEATVYATGKDFYGESAAEDLYAAIDLLVDKLDRQLIRHKEKLSSRR